MASVNDKLFQAISIIVEDSINKSTKTLTIKGKIEQKIERTDSYKINYQNTEIVASSMGQAYNNGDEVFVLLPNGNLQTEKFILGKTNNRVPSIIYDSEGLSPETIRLIQEINDKIKDIVSDGVIYPSEKVVLKTQWELIKKSYEEINEQYLPYKDEIDMSKARNAYEPLEQIMNEILADMTTESKVDSTLITNSMGEYLKEDNAVRLRISEELRKELLYKVEIISTNGNIFKNGIISTKLRTKIMEGRKDVTLDIAANSILWQKMNADGTILPSWEKRGHEIEVTTSDVNEKQIFVCSIIVDRATVAQELITIIDVEDISQITTSIKYVVPVSQTLSLETNKYSPDYRDLNLVLTSVVKQGGKLLSSGPIRKWTLDGKEIISNEDMQISSNGSTLTIKNNILNNSKCTGIIKCEVKYEDKKAEITLDDFDTINLSLSVDGRNGAPGQPGENGKTQYTHIAYSNSINGSKDFSVSDSNRDYIGMYVDFIEKGSTTPSDYAWSLIKGATGPQGPPTGIIESPTIPTEVYQGMLWKNTGNLSGFITDVTYIFRGSKWEKYIFTADNIYADNLAAITANLGTVTAGEIITNFFRGDYLNAGIKKRGKTIFSDGQFESTFEYVQVSNNVVLGKGDLILDENGFMIRDLSNKNEALRSVAYNPEGIFMTDANADFGVVALKYQDLMMVPSTQLQPAMNHSVYSTSETNLPTASRQGRSVTLSGAFKNNGSLNSSNDEITMGYLPDWARPSKPYNQVNQGSGMNRFSLMIRPDGSINWGRYGTSSYATVPAGSWLNISCTFQAGDLRR